MSRDVPKPATVQLYHLGEDATGVLLAFMVVFSAWAFGTTQPWSKWTMNACGYLTGVLLACKLAIRGFRGYRPARWGDPGKDFNATSPVPNTEAAESPIGASNGCGERNRLSRALLTRALAGLTVAIVLYCFVSALNARSTFVPRALRFDYRECVSWLPHSLDGSRSWFAFWSYLALACSFWAARDWLLGKTSKEERTGRAMANAASESVSAGVDSEDVPLPARFRWLLWLLAINGLVLAVEGIAQRLEGSGKLLFLVQPRVNPGADTQFGPWAYRANAASYFNLLWPVCVGFWWTLRRSGHGKVGGWLLVSALVMAACPIISTSRGGALITFAMLGLGTVLLVGTHFLFRVRRRESSGSRILTLALLLAFGAGALGLGLSLGWRTLKPRMAQLRENFDNREEMFDSARPMARDYPLFGTGPGTFETVFQLYRVSTTTYWPAQLHNDWLETRITFGWFGSALILLALLTVLARWFARGGIYGGRRFVMMSWLAVAGCLVHARWDFPFQIYSVLFLFLMICAVLFNLSRSPG